MQPSLLKTFSFARSNTVSASLPDSIASTQPGCQVTISGFGVQLAQSQRAALQAYGVLPGRSVTVLQHFPETVIQIEESELAFERDIARLILVQKS